MALIIAVRRHPWTRKTVPWFFALILGVAVVAAGCKKAAPPPPLPVANDVHVSLQKLNDVLSTNTDSAVQESMAKIAAGLRYGYDYEAVMVELDKLNQSPAVTDPQKKIVNEVIEQIKAVINQPKPAQ